MLIQQVFNKTSCLAPLVAPLWGLGAYASLPPTPYPSASARGQNALQSADIPLALQDKKREKKLKLKYVSMEYSLETFRRSNQDTCLIQKPVVHEGDWVQTGDLLADCASSVGGELSLGQNLLIAYMPWEGYNFEDAILISERLVIDDLYTSVHIERYEIENFHSRTGTDMKGREEITSNIPDTKPEDIQHLDSYGIVKIGSWVEEGNILVGKVTPINKKSISPMHKSLSKTLGKKIHTFRDSSLRAPKGIKAKVIDIKYFLRQDGRTKHQDINRRDASVALASARSATQALAPKALAQVESSNYSARLSYLKKFNQNFRFFKSESTFQSKQIPLLKNFKLKFKTAFACHFGAYAPLPLTPCAIGKSERSASLRPWGDVAQRLAIVPERHYYMCPSAFGARAHTSDTRGSTLCALGQALAPSVLSSERTEGAREIERTDAHTLRMTPLVNAQAKSLSRGPLPPRQPFRGSSPLSALGFALRGLGCASRLPKPQKARRTLLFVLSRCSQKNKQNVALALASARSATQALAQAHEIRGLKGPFSTLAQQPVEREKNVVCNNQCSLSAGSYNAKQAKPRHFLKHLETLHIYLAEKRKIQIGDKMAGRHGNKGIVSQILPIQDMPYLPDGTSIDMVLNPLGVPSRMNVGQIYECLLGLAGKYLGEHFKVFSFDEVYGPEASRSLVFSKLFQARCKTGLNFLFNPNFPGKICIYDGRTGECFDQPITVGQAYMLRLVHMVDDKIHMRSVGPYSLVTQQPLRGRSKQGGQRLGEMEVWALEGYGAAFTLLEMLTIKSDDLSGRQSLWSNLIFNRDISIGTPESFKVLICELQALCMDIGLFRYTKLQKHEQKIGNVSKSFQNLTEITSLINFP